MSQCSIVEKTSHIIIWQCFLHKHRKSLAQCLHGSTYNTNLPIHMYLCSNNFQHES